jgi:hypothetical protein
MAHSSTSNPHHQHMHSAPVSFTSALPEVEGVGGAVSYTLCGTYTTTDSLQERAPKPRRRLKDSQVDHAEGLVALMEKTKAISFNADDIDALVLCGHL